MAAVLKLTFEQMVNAETAGDPVIAFRKKGNSKTTATHLSKAKAIGMLLKPLVPFLPELQVLRTQISSPSKEYQKIQAAVTETRKEIGIGSTAVLEYSELISKFRDCGAVLVPVLWGGKADPKNAMHIRLPQEDVTFIYLNLDTHQEDFKFWMSHEFAHVLTPDLAGSDEGEDYADAFAAALLFPKECAERTYRELTTTSAGKAEIIEALRSTSEAHGISINTVFQETNRYARDCGLPVLSIDEVSIHIERTENHEKLISKELFDPIPPEPARYINASESIFESNFFIALKRMIHELKIGPAYVQQILDISLQDAHGLHRELSG